MSESPVFTFAEIVDMDHRAWHRGEAGAVDFIYDGLTFWHEDDGRRWTPYEGPVPLADWHHRRDCRCRRCREAWAHHRAL